MRVEPSSQGGPRCLCKHPGQVLFCHSFHERVAGHFLPPACLIFRKWKIRLDELSSHLRLQSPLVRGHSIMRVNHLFLISYR